MTAPPLHIILDRARQEVVKARAALEAETPTVLHTHHAPKLTEADDAITKYPDEGGIGLPFTAALHRVLAYTERQNEKPHPETIARWAYSVEMVNRCESIHPEHKRPDGGKPLCAQLVYMAVWCNMDPDEIAGATGRDLAKIRTLLIGALEHAAAWRQAQYEASGPLESVHANETLEDRLRREHDLPHEERVWELHRQKYDLADWPDELAERRQRHKHLRCGNCPLLEEAA